MRTIVITGASGGLVQEVVKLLPTDKLILLGRDRKKLEMLYQYHTAKQIFEVNITDTAAIERVVAAILADNPKIDVLINNAGYGFYKDFDAFSDQETKDMFAVNTFALMSFCRLIGHEMKKAKQGHIINILSMSGLIATAQSSVYSATKFAAMGFSNTIRLELAKDNIAVTTINPGPVATDFFSLADPDGSYQEKVKAFLLQPDYVARQIVKTLKTKKQEVNLPFALQMAYKFSALFPRLSNWASRTFFQYK